MKKNKTGEIKQITCLLIVIFRPNLKIGEGIEFNELDYNGGIEQSAMKEAVSYERSSQAQNLTVPPMLLNAAVYLLIFAGWRFGFVEKER